MIDRVATLPDYPQSDELEEFVQFAANCKMRSQHMGIMEDFQKRILSDYFNGVTESVVILPKKNGKSSVLSLVALYHLFVTPEATVALAASSAKQAGYIYDFAAAIVRLSPGLSGYFKVLPGHKEIRSVQNNGVLKVYASGEDNADGWEGDLFLCDELHRHKNLDLYHVFRAGLGPRGGRCISISTAGDSESSPLGKMRTKAYGYESFQRHGAYRHALSPNGRFALHEYALDNDDDLTDVGLVLQANPASWRDADALAEIRDAPGTSPWQWARFYAGVWVKGEGNLFLSYEWDRYADPTVTFLEGDTVRVGLDVGTAQDSTALTPVQWLDGGERQVIGNPCVLVPPVNDGERTPFSVIETAILTMTSKLDFNYSEFVADHSGVPDQDAVRGWADAIAKIVPLNVATVTFDPTQAQQLTEQLSRDHDIDFVEFRQLPNSLVRADSAFFEAFNLGQIWHTGDETLREHALNVTEKNSGEAFYFHQKRKGEYIDAIRSASMALDTCKANGGMGKAKSTGNGLFIF